MDTERYEQLKQLDTREIDRKLIEYTETLGNEWEDKYDYSRFCMAYFIWLSLKYNVASPSELNNYCNGEDFPPIITDDLIVDYSENLKAWEDLLALKESLSLDELEAYILFFELIPGNKNGQDTSSRIAFRLFDTGIRDDVAVIGIDNHQYWIEKLFRGEIKECDIFLNGYVEMTCIFIKSQVLGVNGINFFWIEDEEELRFNKVFAESFVVEDKPEHIYRDAMYGLLEDYPTEISHLWNEIGLISSYISEGGRAVVTIKGGALTESYSEKARRWLLEHGFVEGVIVLPEKLYSDTWLSPYLLILSNGNKETRFLDCRDIYTEDRDKGKRINILSDDQEQLIVEKYKDDTDVVSVPIDEVIANDSNLSPIRYLSKSIDNVNTIELGSVIRNISRGATLTGKQLDEMLTDEITADKCLLPINVHDGIVDGCLYTNEEFFKKHSQNVAHRGDLLLTKSGNPYRAAISDADYLIIGNLYILKIDSKKISSSYVKCYLESEMGQSELLRFSTGAKTPLVSLANLKKVRIPVYDQEKMAQLTERSEELTKDVEEAFRVIKESRTALEVLF